VNQYLQCVTIPCSTDQQQSRSFREGGRLDYLASDSLDGSSILVARIANLNRVVCCPLQASKFSQAGERERVKFLVTITQFDHFVGGHPRFVFLLDPPAVAALRHNGVSIEPGNPVSVHLFGAIRCRFIFSGKNDALTPDFSERTRTPTHVRRTHPRLHRRPGARHPQHHRQGRQPAVVIPSCRPSTSGHSITFTGHRQTDTGVFCETPAVSSRSCCGRFTE